jgi:hypothetical protein
MPEPVWRSEFINTPGLVIPAALEYELGKGIRLKTVRLSG